MITGVGDGLGDTSSNPAQGCLLFTWHSERYESSNGLIEGRFWLFNLGEATSQEGKL